jgi:hypothetical protein
LKAPTLLNSLARYGREKHRREGRDSVQTSNFKGALLATCLLGLSGQGWAQQPSQSQIAAIRQSCRSDYQSYCASVPTGGQQALSCLREHADSLSPACGKAVAAAGGASTSAPSAAQSAAPRGNPRAEAALVREQCSMDFRAHCRGVRPGGGRAIACLADNQESLSPGCKSALSSMRSAR